MNPFDVVLLVLLGVLVLVGIVKGLTRILIGIGALVAAFALAAHFHQPLADRLARIDLPDELLRLIAYGLIFFGTMIAGGVLATIVRKFLKVAMLSWADRLAGGALGAVAAALVSALLVLPLVAYSDRGERALRGSMLAPYVSVVADFANLAAPDELSETYRSRIEDLRRHWAERADSLRSRLERS